VRVRAENSKLEDIGKKLAVSLERLRIELNVDRALWSDILGITPAEYEKVLQQKMQVSLTALEALANYLDVSMDMLISGGIDYRAMAARLRGELTILPERYTVGAFSSKRTVVNLLAFLEESYGWRMVKLLLRRLQVHEAAFQDSDGSINIRFQGDLCDQLIARGFTVSDLRRLGAYSPVTNKSSAIGKILGSSRDSVEVYTRMIEEASVLYDKNCDYSILSMDRRGCSIAARPTVEAQDALKTKTPGSLGSCSTKAGVFESATSYIHAPSSHVNEIRCIHRGDPVCEYRVDFSAKLPSFLAPALSV
jgi:hypothetical protein